MDLRSLGGGGLGRGAGIAGHLAVAGCPEPARLHRVQEGPPHFASPPAPLAKAQQPCRRRHPRENIVHDPADTPVPEYDATAKQKSQVKTARIPIKVVPAEVLKKPEWIREGHGSPRKPLLRDQADPVNA